MLINICLLAAVGGTLAVFSWLMFDSHDRTRRIAEQAEMNIVEAMSENYEHSFEVLAEAIEGTKRAVQHPAIWSLPPDVQQLALFGSLLSLKGVSSMIVIGRDGRVRAQSNNLDLGEWDFSDREYFLYHKTHSDLGLHIIGPTPSRFDNKTIIILSKRVNDSNGEFAGVVAGGIYVSHFWSIFRNFDLGSNGSIALGGVDGHVIARIPRPDFAAERATGAEVGNRPMPMHLKQSSTGTYVSLSPFDGAERLFAYRKLNQLPFVALFGRSTKDVYAEWQQMAFIMTVVMALITSLILGLTWGLNRQLSRRRQAERDALENADELCALARTLEERVQSEVVRRREATEKLVAGQRLEALGRLASGIAHDINNVLQTVSNACVLLRAPDKPHKEILRLTDVALSATDRGSATTQRLLVFARKAPIMAGPIDTAALLNDLRELLSHTLGDSIKVVVNHSQHIGQILADRRQLETVIVNLATNARDAMAAGGTITISFKSETMAAEETTLANPDLSSEKLVGDFVRIDVTDTGIGMDESVLRRAVDPFFSTKDEGKGTGLGLSMAKSFVEQSNGRFNITSRLGVGTTVSLWFPVYDGDQEAEAELATTHDPALDGASVLVVDDNDNIRELTCESLREAGFRVHEARSGPAALTLVSTHTPIDLVLTDFSMPEMNGTELIKAARRMKPALAAIILTGDIGEVSSLETTANVRGGYVVLQKPIRIGTLIQHIETVLKREPVAG